MIDFRLFEFLYLKGDVVEYRLLANDREQPPQSFFITGGTHLNGHKINNDVYNVYFGVNPRMNNSKSLVERVVACFTDCDSKHFSSPEDYRIHIQEKLIELKKMNLYPSCRVNSGHGEHWYWKLKESPKIELKNRTVHGKKEEYQECLPWTNTQKALQAFIKGCSVFDFPRILRIPGTLNIKDEPVECKIIEISGAIYDISEFVALEGEEELPPWDGEVDSKDNVDIQKAVVDVLMTTPGTCDTYEDFVRMAMALKSAGYQYEEVDAIFRGSQGYDLENNRKIYAGLKPNRITMRTAYYYAQKHNPVALQEAIGRTQKIEIAKPATKESKKKPTKKLTTESYIDFFANHGWKFSLNEMTDEVFLGEERYEDIAAAKIRAVARDYFKKPAANLSHMSDAIIVAADMAKFHPIRDFFDTLKWDGVDRIIPLCNHFTSEGNMFHRWFPHWLYGSIGRVYERYQNPMLVLDGPQDVGKSWFSCWICPIRNLFLSAPIVPDNKDCRLRLINSLVWEVMELGATTKRQDVDALKGFLTLEEVRDRKPYGRHDVVKPALASFIGTINNDAGFLVDRTGNRRFLVCEIKKIDFSYTKIDKMQVWAQAKEVYKTKEWRLSVEDKKDREHINEQFMISDPVDEVLTAHIEFTGQATDFVDIPRLLAMMKERTGSVNRGTAMAIAAFMTQLGAKKGRMRIGNLQPRGYHGVKLLGL